MNISKKSIGGSAKTYFLAEMEFNTEWLIALSLFSNIKLFDMEMDLDTRFMSLVDVGTFIKGKVLDFVN